MCSFILNILDLMYDITVECQNDDKSRKTLQGLSAVNSSHLSLKNNNRERVWAALQASR